MARRKGQSGYIDRKGRMWVGRYWEDVPGEEKRRRAQIPVAPIDSMTKSEAKRRLRELLTEIGVNTEGHFNQAIRPVRTFEEEVAWWMANKMSCFKKSRQVKIPYDVKKHLLPRFGAAPLHLIDERAVQEWVSDMRKADNLAPRSIYNVVALLKQILGKKLCKDWQLKMPEIPQVEQRYFSEREMLQIVGAARGRYRVIFAVLAGSGIRAGEAFGLRVEDINFGEGKIYIRRSAWEGDIGTPKTKKGYRVVDVEPAVLRMLKDHLGARRSGFVFASRNGTPLRTNNVRRQLHILLNRLGIPRGGLHAFRHGRVSLLRKNGTPDDLVKEWVGHSNLRMTSKYTHFDDEFRRKSAERVGLWTQMDPNSEVDRKTEELQAIEVAGPTSGGG